MIRFFSFVVAAPAFFTLVACSSAAETGTDDNEIVASPQLKEERSDRNAEAGATCGGPSRIRCAKGYVCNVTDSGDTDRGDEGKDALGTCAKDDCPTGTDCSVRAATGSGDDELCAPSAEVYCVCTNGEKGTKTCADDGASFSACACRSPSADGTICTPNAYVYCACPNGNGGTQECASDGKSLSACAC